MTHLNKNKFKTQTRPYTNSKRNYRLQIKVNERWRFLIESWFSFCCPSYSQRTSRVYFLKKNHKNPHGIRPVLSSCGSITESISTFIDHWPTTIRQTITIPQNELELYMKTINSLHKAIKFTYESSKEELTFFDITLYKGERFKTENMLDIKTHQTNQQTTIGTGRIIPPNSHQKCNYEWIINKHCKLVQ